MTELSPRARNPATMHWAPCTPCTGLYFPIDLSDELPPLLCAAGAAGLARDTLARPSPALAPADEPPGPGALPSYWWLWRAVLEATKGDRLGGQVGPHGKAGCFLVPQHCPFVL